MKRYGVNPSQAVKNYYDYLLYSCGKEAKDIAPRIGLSAVSLCNLAPRLEQMTGQKLSLFAKEVGVCPGEMLITILKLRKNPKHDIYFASLPKNFRVERIERATRKKTGYRLLADRERQEQNNGDDS